MESWTSKFTETIKKLKGKHKYHVQFIITKCSFKKKQTTSLPELMQATSVHQKCQVTIADSILI